MLNMTVSCRSNLIHWWPKRSNAILMYHSVGNKNGFGNVSIPRFKQDLDYLIEKGYKIVNIKKIMSGSKRISLTFDDGLMSFYKNVYPILQEYQIPAIVFVIANTVLDDGEVRLQNSQNTMGKVSLGK